MANGLGSSCSGVACTPKSAGFSIVLRVVACQGPVVASVVPRFLVSVALQTVGELGRR